MRGLDYSAGRIDGHTIRAAGYDFVIRYVDDPARGLNSKHITPDEYRNLIANGVTVYLVFEIDTTDALGGFGAGQANAGRARRGADWIGYPPGGLIFFCSDRHLTNDQIPTGLAYLDGAASVIGRPAVGAYGFWEFVDAAIAQNKAAAYWQCGIAPDPTDPVQVWQQNTGTVTIGGIQCDIDAGLRPIVAPAPDAAGGIESMALDTSFTDWANNTQTVKSWMDHVDERLARLDTFLFTPGSEKSRIPNDTNTTNGHDAVMDTVARVSVAKAEVEAVSAKVDAQGAKLDALSAKLDAVQTPTVDLDVLAAKVAAVLPPSQPIDYAALAAALAPHLAGSVQFTAK